MKAKDVVKVWIWATDANDGYSDITDGILSINTTLGSDTFQGFWDNPDVGQFTIVARGSIADPNIDANIKTNAFISIFVDRIPEQYGIEYPVFTGFITDINVEYRKGEKPLITINGTDTMGYLNRLVVTQEAIDNHVTPDYADNIVPLNKLFELSYELGNLSYNDFIMMNYVSAAYPFLGGGNVGFYVSPQTPFVKVEAGKTIYELMAPILTSGLIMYYEETYAGWGYRFSPYMKYDYSYYQGSFNFGTPFAWFKTNMEDPWQYGGTDDPNYDLTFKSIYLNNGINKIVNQVSVTNTNPKTDELTTIAPVIDSNATNEFGPAKLEANTVYTTTTNSFWLPTSTVEAQVAQYQNDILEYQAVPKSNIESITIDMLKYIQSYNTLVLGTGFPIHIQHKIDNNNYIYGDYVISGIKHTINESEWTAELIVRDSDVNFIDQHMPKIPQIQVSASNGNTNTTFTASITNYTNTELDALAKIEWMVNLPWYFDATQPPSRIWTPLSDDPQTPYNIPIITGKTPSWTYNDSGVLANYPEFYRGPGYYTVAVWVTNADGFTSVGRLPYGQFIEIIGNQAHADFGTNITTYGEATFYDNSAPDTISWNWNFGDGTTYSGQNPPTKVYASPGTYNVSLTVSNGSTTDVETKPITIVEAALPVRYIRLRFQGTVTKAAGQADYTTDLIDTFGALRTRGTGNMVRGENMPFYINVRNLDKVQAIAETPYIPTWWTDAYEPVFVDTPGTYNGQGILNPMSQSYVVGQDSRLPKYKFHPIITDNPDGSQTKTYDFDLVWDYSKVLTGNLADYYDGRQTPAKSYTPGGNPAYLSDWTSWNTEKGNINSFRIYPSSYKEVTIQGNLVDKYGHIGDAVTPVDRTYLPITISVSHDGVTYRTVGTATYTTGNEMTVNYTASMPPTNAAPIQT